MGFLIFAIFIILWHTSVYGAIRSKRQRRFNQEKKLVDIVYLLQYINTMAVAREQMTYVDLFAGAGGLSLGFYKSGFKGLFAVEKSIDAYKTLEHNLINAGHFDWPEWFPQQPHAIEDVIEKYKKQLVGMRGKVDIVVGGPPCQGFSMAGVRNHEDARNKMVDKYIEFVGLVQPKFIFFENVHGISVEFKIENQRVRYSEIVASKLRDLGYSVKCSEIKISDFGVPQKRKRFILVGSLNGKVDDFFERLKDRKESFLKKRGLRQTATVFDAVSDLLMENGTKKCEDCKGQFQSGIYGAVQSDYQKFMRSGVNCLSPNSHRYANHTPKILAMHEYMISNIEKGKRITPNDNLVDGLKRRGVTILDESSQAPTIMSIPDDFVHYSEPRILTAREMARIQSFPDWYEFKGKYTTGGSLRRVDVPRYTQIGNAVPPLFAEQVAEVFREVI